MEKIIHPTYFPSIKIFSELVKIDELLFEVNDNYQKQTEFTLFKTTSQLK